MRLLFVLLRLIGIISFLGFLLLIFVNYQEEAIISLIISVCCFLSILMLQLYRFYIQSFIGEDDADLT